MHRQRNAKLVATLGPASSDRATIQALFEAGADVFRLNFSHGSHADHKARLELIRAVERETGRPIGVLVNLQGPKLRVGTFAAGPVQLVEGEAFRLDLERERPGDTTRVAMPHPEIFQALVAGTDLLLDDGRIRLRVERCGADFAETRVIAGGPLSDRKGVNVPGVVLPLSALTAKDRADLDYALTLGIDWIALSFVQPPRTSPRSRPSSRAAPASSPSSRSRPPSAAWRPSSPRATPSWWRAATSGWRCRPSRCRRSRSASCAPAARPASR